VQQYQNVLLLFCMFLLFAVQPGWHRVLHVACSSVDRHILCARRLGMSAYYMIATGAWLGACMYGRGQGVAGRSVRDDALLLLTESEFYALSALS
jgi:hypothetical protein